MLEIAQALHQLFYDPDMAQKNVAQKWLTQAQMSPQAWHFCWSLLRQEKVSIHTFMRGVAIIVVAFMVVAFTGCTT